MRKFFIILGFVLATAGQAQVMLNSEGREEVYVAKIIERSQKITDKLGISDQQKAQNVTNIIANRYFMLNDIHDEYKNKVKFAKDSLPAEKKNHVIENVGYKRDAELYKHHFELEANLSNYLDDKQIEQVKDGMTFGVVDVTYNAYCDMIPSLKEEEKIQIKAWLKEAREFAMDAESSNKKHEWFKKYKGRINNYLSARGYDINKEREEWKKRASSN